MILYLKIYLARRRLQRAIDKWKRLHGEQYRKHRDASKLGWARRRGVA